MRIPAVFPMILLILAAFSGCAFFNGPAASHESVDAALSTGPGVSAPSVDSGDPRPDFSQEAPGAQTV